MARDEIGEALPQAGDYMYSEAVAEGGRLSTLRALRHRNYRYLWLGQVGHSASLWMEQVVRPLLILELTHSAMMVGLVVVVRMLPVLTFGLVAGAVADRYDRRRVLMYCQAVALLTNVALGLLLVLGRAQVWHVFLTAALNGTATAFIQPVRQALVPQLVPRQDLLNALALSNAAMNTMRIGGAALAGLLLVFFNYGEVYLLNGMIYVGVIWTTLQLRVPGDDRPRKERGSLLRSLAEGFRYVGTRRDVRYLVGMALILFLFGMSYQQVFVPLLALNVLHIGKSGAGWMLAASGVGALTSSLLLASRSSIRARGRIMMVMLAMFSLFLVLLAQSHWVLLSYLAMMLTGGSSVAYMALNNTVLLERTPAEFHGRIMSLMSLDRGLVAVGAVIGAALADTLGPQTGLTIMGSIAFVLISITFIAVPSLRRMA